MDPCDTMARTSLTLVTHWQEHHSRMNIDHLEQLFVSAVLRNQLKFFKRSQLIPFCSNL